MADFCRQCYYELWGEFRSDFAHMYPKKKPLQPGYGYPVLCESCGPTLVNEAGECIAHCSKAGHPKYDKRNAPAKREPSSSL